MALALKFRPGRPKCLAAVTVRGDMITLPAKGCQVFFENPFALLQGREALKV